MLLAANSAFAIFNAMDSLTIVAPMTPAGVSAVAALRVSGTHVRDVVRRLFGLRAAEKLVPRMANLGTARDPQTGKVLDSLLYIYFEAPNSYTGEDVLELYPHGNPLIVRDLLQAIRGIEGVRLAEPGEYTRRAFLNGKMDLPGGHTTDKVGEKFAKLINDGKSHNGEFIELYPIVKED